MDTSSTPVHQTRPRTTAQVTLPGGLTLEAPVGTRLEAYFQQAHQIAPEQVPTMPIAAIFNGRLRELTLEVRHDGEAIPVLLTESDGGRIYRRSLTLLMIAAADRVFKGIRINVGYAVPNGGFYCFPVDHPPLSEPEVQRLEAEMRAMVEQDLPITKQVVTLAQAIAMFAERGDNDKVRLMENRARRELTLYTLDQRADYYYGYMVASTRYLTTFRLIHRANGFILQYPTSDDPEQLSAVIPGESKIGAVFAEAESWLNRIGVADVGQLNALVGGAAARTDDVQELLLVAEAQHEQQIASIAGEIYRRQHDHGLRLVLLAGPSSSGKTTSSKRLALQLLAYGLRPFTLELDNYFVDRDLTPRDSEGNFDFEALEAINLPLFNQHLLKLTQGEAVRLPTFDFIAGKSVEGPLGKLTDNQVLICEGIHGLNPRLVTQIPDEKIFRLYVSPLTQLNLDSHNRIPTTDVRLLRRICRDAVQRGYSATATIERWNSVRRGEKRNIFPFQENADVIFNSSLVYELAALRPIAEPLLLQVEVGTHTHIEANRLLSFLRWVRPLNAAQQALIPDTSLLREFIGGSILADYHPGTLATRDV